MWLAAETFHYSALERAERKTKEQLINRFPEKLGKRLKGGLPPKVGSSKAASTLYIDLLLWMFFICFYPSIIKAQKGQVQCCFIGSTVLYFNALFLLLLCITFYGMLL